MEELSWLLLLAACGFVPAFLFYLGFVRRFTGTPATAFRRREPGRAGEEAGKPPADAWSPRLSGFLLQLCVHLVNTAFGQLFLVPVLMQFRKSYRRQ